MNVLAVVGAIVMLAAYVWLAGRLLVVLLKGEDLRTWLGSLRALGPGQVLRWSWKALLLIVVGMAVLIAGVISFSTYQAYRAAPSCVESHAADCRDLRLLDISRVEQHSSKSGQKTVVYFDGGYPPAGFYSSDVPASSVPAGSLVTAEVWRGDVTAVVIQGSKHESFATRSDAWFGIAGGAGVLLLGCMWLLIDLALASVEPTLEPSRHAFATPARRRRALYVLLPTFAALNCLLGVALIAFAFGAAATGNTLAAVYLIGAVLVVPTLIVFFVAWFIRAYINVGALGHGVRHSAWFVLAAVLVPPFSLYMPLRLIREVATKTSTPVSSGWLHAWWASAVGWVVLTIVGLTIESPDPNAPSTLQSAVLLGSVAVGALAAFFTLRLISAVDSAEVVLAAQPRSA